MLMVRDFLLICSFLGFVSYGTAKGDYLDEQERALHIIADFSDRLCQKIPLTGRGSNLELSGEAKAELNELLKKFANIGITGAAKYQQSEYQNVLQQDLARELNDSRDCKLKGV
jgi:hypothetical protein